MLYVRVYLEDAIIRQIVVITLKKTKLPLYNNMCKNLSGTLESDFFSDIFYMI